MTKSLSTHRATNKTSETCEICDLSVGKQIQNGGNKTNSRTGRERDGREGADVWDGAGIGAKVITGTGAGAGSVVESGMWHVPDQSL